MGGRAKLPHHGDNHSPGGADPLKSWGAADGDVLTADGAGSIAWESPGGGGIAVYFGSGTPEGAQTGNVGDVYVRSNGLTGTTVYEKTSGTGNTGWTARAILGGGIVESDLAFADITTANASTSAHGLLPKLDNNALHVLNGQGAWVAVPVTWDSVWDVILTKASDESVTSSAVLQNDDDLFFTGVSGAVYIVEIILIYTSASATPDLAWNIGEDNTLRGVLASRHIGTTETPALNASFAQSDAFNSVGTPTSGNRVVHAHGWYISAGGTVRVKWCQNVSNANATTVKAGSTLRRRRIL